MRKPIPGGGAPTTPPHHVGRAAGPSGTRRGPNGVLRSKLAESRGARSQDVARGRQSDKRIGPIVGASARAETRALTAQARKEWYRIALVIAGYVAIMWLLIDVLGI